MKRCSIRFLATAAIAVCVGGCFFFPLPSPYDHTENWLIREDATREFAVPADVFYVQGGLYASKSKVPVMYAYVNSEVGNGKFAGFARVFAPLIANEDDLNRAIDWYFRHPHNKHRPFIFIGEGEGGKLLHAYEQRRLRKMRKLGLAASFYTDTAHKGFVTAETVKEAKAAVARLLYKRCWGRDMPESMANER